MPAAAPQAGVASLAAGWPVWALAWAQPADDAPATRLAAGSLLPLSANVVQIVSYDHAYCALRPEPDLLLPLPAPAIDAAFAPQQESVLATAGDVLRVWRLRDGGGNAGGTGAAAAAAKAPGGAVSAARVDASCTVLRGPESAEWSLPLTCCAWAPPDGAPLLATGTVEGVLTLWDVAAGRAVSRWAAHAGSKPLHRCAWRDGATLLTVGADGVAALWDARAGGGGVGGGAPACRVVTGPGGAGRRALPLRHAAWAPGAGAGRLLALACADAISVSVFDVRGGAGQGVPLAELALDQGCVNALAWAPRGDHVAVGATDARLLVWPAPPPGAPPAREAVQPTFGFAAAAEVNALAWAGPQPGAIAIAHGSTLQVLNV